MSFYKSSILAQDASRLLQTYLGRFKVWSKLFRGLLSRFFMISSTLLKTSSQLLNTCLRILETLLDLCQLVWDFMIFPTGQLFLKNFQSKFSYREGGIARSRMNAGWQFKTCKFMILQTYVWKIELNTQNSQTEKFIMNIWCCVNFCTEIVNPESAISWNKHVHRIN